MTPKTLTSIAIATFLVACTGPEDDANNHDVENHQVTDAGDAHTDEPDAGPDAGSDAGRDAGHDDHDHGHGDDASSVDLGDDVTISPEAESYCECMLVNCHDPFHAEWGESDPEAIASCEAEASAQDEAVLQCWQMNCESVDTDGVTCLEALGEGC